MKNSGWLLVALAGATCGAAVGAEWYAEVETTGGDFTIRLDWERAPNGCGAFAALAAGVADWVNPQSGTVEKGVEYYPGTAMGWVPMDGEQVALLGNRGRVFTGADGTENVSNGSGLTLEDDIRDGGGKGLEARSVAMINGWGPDTLDGRWAVMLKNLDVNYGGKWSRIGTVVSNWAVVEGIAGGDRDGMTGMLEEPATVTGVRVWSEPPEALESWRAGATNWPVCGLGSVSLKVKGEEGTLRCGWSPKSQYAVVHCGDLTAESKSVAWMDWNEDEGEKWAEIPFYATEEKSAPGTVWFGKRHFCAVAEARYPKLTGPATGRPGYGLLTEQQWGDGTVDTYLHEVDWAEGTGTVWKATADGGWEYDATVVGMGFWRAGAHSVELLMGEFVSSGWTYTYDYQLGAVGEDGVGRFRLEVLGQEVWGDYAWVETAGGRKAVGRRIREKRFARPGDGSEGAVPTGEWRGVVPAPARGARGRAGLMEGK